MGSSCETASNSNIKILQRFQSKTPRSLIDAPRYVTNETSCRTQLKKKYPNSVIDNIRVNDHQNPLIIQLPDDGSDPQAKKTLSFRCKH